MAKLVINNAKKADLLQVDRQTYLESLDWRLFVNNLTPTSDSVNGDFTECTDTGYGPLSPTFDTFSLQGSGNTAVGRMSGPPLTNTMDHDSGDYVIYGQYATDPSDSDVWVFAQRFTTPLNVVAAGQQVQVLPKWDTTQIP